MLQKLLEVGTLFRYGPTWFRHKFVDWVKTPEFRTDRIFINKKLILNEGASFLHMGLASSNVRGINADLRNQQSLKYGDD